MPVASSTACVLCVLALLLWGIGNGGPRQMFKCTSWLLFGQQATCPCKHRVCLCVFKCVAGVFVYCKPERVRMVPSVLLAQAPELEAQPQGPPKL
jgi:hypothetical protein